MYVQSLAQGTRPRPRDSWEQLDGGFTVHSWKAENGVVYAVVMNPFRSRLWRTVILFLAGIVVCFVLATIFSPHWPEFCDGTIVGAPCQAVATQTMAGYLIVALGFFTIILGPIAGSALDIAINGAKWEMPRGRDTIVSNMPLLVGAIYLGVGVLTIATA